MTSREREERNPYAYQSPYQDEWGALEDEITNRPAFKFDVNEEALYDYYNGEHQRQARVAKMDTEGELAGLTGGYDNSYARQRGQQAYDKRMDALHDDVVPALRQTALDKYEADSDALAQRYENLQDAEDEAYKDWEKEYGDLYEDYESENEDTGTLDWKPVMPGLLGDVSGGNFSPGQFDSAVDRVSGLFPHDVAAVTSVAPSAPSITAGVAASTAQTTAAKNQQYVSQILGSNTFAGSNFAQAVAKMRAGGVSNDIISGLLSREDWETAVEQAVKELEAGKTDVAPELLVYNNYTEYMRAYVQYSLQNRYGSGWDFSKFSWSYYLVQPEEFQRAASADEARLMSNESAQRVRELAWLQMENEALTERLQTVATSETEQEQNRMGEIYQQYGDIDEALAKARLEDDILHNEAEYLSVLRRVKNAPDFAEKSAIDGYFPNWGIFAYVNDEERAVYNYLYATEGIESAMALLTTRENLLKQRYGEAMAEDVKGNFLGQMAIKAEAGIDQFTSGIASLFNDGEAKSPSALQYANAAVDEDLGDVDLKWYNFAEGKWVDQKIFGRSLGQIAGDTTQTLTNLAPSVAAGYINPWAGAILMGSSAAGNSYQDMLNQGYSKDTAAAYGVMTGLSEVALEKVLGGITALGGGRLTAKMTKNLSKVDDVLTRFAKSTGGKALLNAGSEAIEEGLQAILDPYFKAIVTGEEFTVDVEETLYNALMGFVTGGLLEGSSAVTGSIVSHAQNAKQDEQIREMYRGSQQDLVTEALELDHENAFAKQMQDKLDKGKNLSGSELNKLVQMNETAIEQGKSSSEDAQQPQTAVDTALGKNVARTSKAAVSAQTGAEDVSAATVRNGRKAETTAASPELEAASKKYGAQAQVMVDAYEDGQDVEQFDREYKLAYEMGKEGTSMEFTMESEALSCLTESQRSAAYTSGAAAAENASMVQGMVKELGITGNAAQVLTQSFNANQITAKDYAMGLQEAYNAGKTGVPMAEAGNHAAKLTDQQRQIPYKQGQKAHGMRVAKQQAQARKNRSAKGSDTSKGKVHFEGDRSSLNKTQRASMDAMEVLAKALGVQIYVENFEGTKNANKNGWYDPKDGSIHININAGADGKGTMLFTVAHELTHFIRQWSPAKFRVLANFVTKQYAEKGISIRELMDDQIAKAKEDGRELTDEEALEEVVADSMETMLSDGSVIEMMAELRQQDKGLWQKICDWFKDLAEKLRAVVDAYKGVQPDSTEGRMVADMKDMIGTLQALYMDALVDASENFDAGVQKITTEDSGGVKYQARPSIKSPDVLDPKTVTRADVAEMLEGVKAGKYAENSYIPVRISTPGIVQERLFASDIPIIMPVSKVAQALKEDSGAVKGKNIRGHGLSPEQLIDIIERMDSPDHVYAQNNGRGVEVIRLGVDSNNIVVIVEFDNNVNPAYMNGYEGGVYNVSVTAFNVDGGDVGLFMYSQEKGWREVFNKQKEGDPAKKFPATRPFAIEQDSLKDNVSQRQLEVNKEFSNRDSVGNQLSEEQQEYFKDSKERDNQGRLRVMYRGDSTEVTVFDRKKSSYSNLYGRGFYFTSSASHAGQYGQAAAYYLNITNPVSTTDCTINKEQMWKFLEAVAENEDDYSFENYGYGATVESVLEGLYTGKSDFAMLYDVSQTAIGDMVEAVELFNKTNGTNYDGFILDTETVIFNSAQAKRTDNHNPTANPDTRFSQRDVGRQEAVTQALEKENAKLREDVAELRELVKLQRQVTNGTKFTKTSVEAAARYLKQNANAKGDTKGLMKLLNGLYEYIASAKELTWEDVKEQAQEAVDWLWEHIDRRGKPTEYAQEILRQIHGSRVRLDESQMAEAAYRFGSYDAFRKGLMGNITLAKNAETSLDSLWAEFSEMYPDVFDGEISAADMPSALMDVIHRLRSPDTTIDYARNRELMEQELLRDIYDSYWRVSTLYTPADVGARRINKLKMEHYQRMDKLKQQHRETVDRLKQEYQSRLEQVRMEHRAKLEEKTDQITKKYQEARKKNVEGRRKTEMRGKIRKVIRDLNKLLAHGTKERNVKEGMKDFVSTAIASAEVLFTDEYTNEDMVRNGVACYCEAWESSLLDKTRALIRQRDDLLAIYPTAKEMDEVVAGDLSGYEQRMKEVRQLERKISENMGKLRDVFVKERARMNEATVSSLLSSLAEEYWKLGTADEEYIRGALDKNVHQHLMSLSEKIGGTAVKDMSLSQLEQLHKAYTMVLTTVRNANKNFAENLEGSCMEQAKAVTSELAQAGKNRKKQTKGQIARAKRSWNNLKSVYALERIGSGTLKKLYENLRSGEDTWMVDMDHAREHFLKAARDSGYNGWDLNKQTHSFESSTGLKFDLNLGQIMSIYAYARRGQQALDHLMKGGFVFDKYTEERVTKHGIPKTYLKDDATAYNLSLQTTQEIIGKLTPEQRAFVETMQDYLSDTMGAKGNEVSMKLYGVKLFGEKFYFPLRSSEVYSPKAADQEQQKQQGQVSVKNAGFTHSTTPNAANPVVLSGFMDVWANHVNDMSMYHAFVLPMEDFNKVYHYGTPHTEEGQSGAVKQAIINAHGSAATDYINQFIRDLNGGVVADPREGDFKAWISKFKKASVMASASVVIQQPTAIVRALAYIDPKYFGAFTISRGIGRALGNKVTHNHTKLYDELKKYAPVAAIKQMGRFDTDMGMGAVGYLTAKEFNGFKEHFKAIFAEKGYLGKRLDEVTGFLAERADEIAWAQIWQAVKKEVADKQGLKMGSEEHLKAAGKRFTEVISKTQVYDSVFSRSANMRSKGAFMSMATSFMAEPTTTANMIADAVRKARQGDVKTFLRVGASVAGAVIFNNILRSLVYAARDDDEDETFIEKYLQALTVGVFDDINPMNYLPFWRDVWSLAQGYDVERADMSVIGTAIDAATSLGRVLAEDTSEMTEDQLQTHNDKLAKAGWKFVDGLASLVGLPEKNLRRDILGAVNFFETIKADGSRETTSNSLRDKVWEDFVSSVPGVNIVVDTDSKTDNLYDAIVAGDSAYVERLKSGYNSEHSYLQAKRKGLKENDLRIKTAAEARIAGKLETYMNIAKEIIAEGRFTQDDVVVAINGVINELTGTKASTSAPKAKGLFSASDFAVAIAQDDAEMAKTIRKDIIQTAQRNGKTEEEAQKSFVSSVTFACKEMFSEGEMSENQAVDALVFFCEKDKTEAQASVAYWDFIMEHPDEGASAGWFETYYRKVEKAGIDIEDYVEYRNRRTGYANRAEILKIIDGMNLPKAQKDALYRAEGYAESTLNDAPWH